MTLVRVAANETNADVVHDRKYFLENSAITDWKDTINFKRPILIKNGSNSMLIFYYDYF